MSILKSVVSIVFALFVTSLASNTIGAEKHDKKIPHVFADLIGGDLMFSVSNHTGRDIYVNSTFLSDANLSLFVVLENELTPEMLKYRPSPMGNTPVYFIKIKNGSTYKQGKLFNSRYPEINGFEGESFIIFWSADIFVANDNGNFSMERFSGSKRISKTKKTGAVEHTKKVFSGLCSAEFKLEKCFEKESKRSE